jgi:hypothetical protein
MSFINITSEILNKLKCKKIKHEKIELKNKAPKSLKKSLKLRCIDA